MIEQFFRPEQLGQALELKARFGNDAVYMGGGSKLNAAPTRTDKKVAISLGQLGLGQIDQQHVPEDPAVLRVAGRKVHGGVVIVHYPPFRARSSRYSATDRDLEFDPASEPDVSQRPFTPIDGVPSIA